jgi:hypothetical protein
VAENSEWKNCDVNWAPDIPHSTSPPVSNAVHAGNTAAGLNVPAVRGSGYDCSGDPSCSGWFGSGECCDSFPQFTVNGGSQVGNSGDRVDDNDNPTWNLAVSD